MTKTKGEGKCPLCGKLLKCVSKHLREIHHLQNKNERTILNNLATGRVLLGSGRCPLPLCNTQVLHLDKHLRGHKDITQRRLARELKSLKQRTAISQLAELRATNPNPPLVSKLDEEEEASEDETAAGPDRCNNPSCIHARRENKELQREVRELRQDIRLLRVSEWKIHGNISLHLNELELSRLK